MPGLRKLVFVAAFLLALLLAGLSHRSTLAQDPPDPPGTVPPPLFLPLVALGELPPPPGVYGAIPVDGRADNRPAALHADLNLALRSYTPTVAALTLIDLGGDTDPDAPQLDGLFDPMRAPTITAVSQVYEWDWGCEPDGCRGQPLADWEVTLIEVAAAPNEPLHLPWRAPQIHSGGYRAMVLYAEPTRLTLVFTRRDGADHGYVVHLEEIQVDVGLLALYEALDSAGRTQLPALANGERLGYASSTGVLRIAIRDTGQFMDPRSRKDWWMGHLMANS
jgi:hypothetical protein